MGARAGANGTWVWVRIAAVPASRSRSPVNMQAKWMQPSVTDRAAMRQRRPRGRRANGSSSAATAANRIDIRRIGGGWPTPGLGAVKIVAPHTHNDDTTVKSNSVYEEVLT